MINRKLLLLLASLSAGPISCRTAQTPPPSATDVGVPGRMRDLGPAVYSGDRRPAVFPSEWPLKAGKRAVFGTHAVVASDASLATTACVPNTARLPAFKGHSDGNTAGRR